AWIRLNPVTWQNTRRLFVRSMQQIGVMNSKSQDRGPSAWETTIGEVYRKFTAWLERLELLEGKTQTANERGLAFAGALPESTEDAWIIIKSYERERFGEHNVDATGVMQAWRRLRLQLWMAWLWRLTDRWRE
ncbi:MAG: DUF4129 domain-containing protein, partial [Anaerolineales bacterium]